MGRDYDNLWVLNEKGQIIFSYIQDEDFNPEMIGEMLIAFNALIKKLNENEISCIDWDKKIIHIIKENKLIFASCTEPGLKLEKVEEKLSYIANRFFSIYSTVLINDFDGDRSIFANCEERFTQVVENAFD